MIKISDSLYYHPTMKPSRQFRAHHSGPAVLALTLVLTGPAAHAQLRLPTLNLPLPPAVSNIEGQLRRPADRLLGQVDLRNIGVLRQQTVGRLLRQHRDELDADPRGEPVVRREIVAFAPSQAGLDAARAAGLTVIDERAMDAPELGLVVLRAPAGANVEALLAMLRASDPQGAYDYNPVYTGSGSDGSGTGTLQAVPARTGGAALPDSRARQIGLIDSGVDSTHEVFRHTHVERWGCAEVPRPHAHGTAVAALMVGQSAHFRGVAPEARLYAADIYCNSPSGGSADKIAGALAWLGKQQVGVINMSIVGPPNQTLERMVATMLRRGHVLVAAVGNDGPAAPPLYPAAYPGVVGVSAVDRRGKVLPEAARGPQVMFAAPGNQMVSAVPGTPPYRPVRGTSYAAPIVAALLAESLAKPDQAGAAQALASLQRSAAAQPAMVSNETGYGVVGTRFRIDPSELR